MNAPELTPKDDYDDNNNNKIQPKNILYNYSRKSYIFNESKCNSEYLEILNNNKEIKIIFRSPEELKAKNLSLYSIKTNELNSFNELTIIFDFQRLSLELNTEELQQIIYKIYSNISRDDFKFNLIIRNTFINPDGKIIPLELPTELILNKLEIWDELYGLSTNLNLDKIFVNIKAKELILKKFKFNSKTQLSIFCQFIQRIECQKLTLEDINIELIIKKDENDEEYKDLDIYFSYLDEVITLDNAYTNITSLTLRDCPMFAIIGNMFKYRNSKDIPTAFKNIDVDENSLINPFIITKFKIHDGKYDICFDLDSLKLKLEEMEDNDENEKDKIIENKKNDEDEEEEEGEDYYDYDEDDKNDKDIDYLDYLNYIFKIIISFKRKNHKTLKQKKKWEDQEDGVDKIQRENFFRLTFKNFDVTKYEYITGEDMTFIDEDKRVFNKEEKIRKKKWENLEKALEKFKYKILDNVRELVFDNCSNFFIKWIIKFLKGEKNEIKSYNDDLDLLKIKKCGKDYVDIKEILKMKINKLILFDTPLIVGDKFPEKGEHLDIIRDRLGSVKNLTIKINSLDCYGKEFNLNTIKTLEILLELIKNNKFNKNLTFELSGLSQIMTFLALKVYVTDQNFYNSYEDEEGKDEIKLEKEAKTELKEFIKIEDSLPKQIFFSSLRKRDYLYYKAFNLNCFDDSSKINLKTLSIKKRIENFDNQNYFVEKIRLAQGKEDNSYTKSNKLKKIDFGSDGFYIDRDYKLFFSENNIGTVELNNVSFSVFKDNTLKDSIADIDTTLLNLIRNTEEEETRISVNNYPKTNFPNYIIDYSTINGILYRNYAFQDVGDLFKYYIYKIIVPNNSFDEKKNSLYDYFEKFKEIFSAFKKNIKKLTIILNNIKELKELFCTLCFLKILEDKNSLVEDTLTTPDKKKNTTVKMPKKFILENEIGIFFLKDKNEENKDCYSEMNYFYLCDDEINMIKKREVLIKKINENNNKIEDYKINLDIRFDYYSEI